MKTIFTTLVLICCLHFGSFGQTTLVDYTNTDCNGNSQNLFSTLAQNNVVILIYEHRCGSCLQGATNVKNVINTFFSSNTDIKIWYLDNGGGTCSVVNTWITNNSLIPGNVFEYSNDNNSPYGNGMPQIVIAAGPSHTVFLNSTGPSNTTTIKNAIDAALASFSVDEAESGNWFDLYPNPVNSNTLTILLSETKYQPFQCDILNLEGQLIRTYEIPQVYSAVDIVEINTEDLVNGIYFISLKTNKGETCRRFIVSR